VKPRHKLIALPVILLPFHVQSPHRSFIVCSVADLWSDLVASLQGTMENGQDRFVWLDMLCFAFGKQKASPRKSIAAAKVAATAASAPAVQAPPGKNDFLTISSIIYLVDQVEVLLTQPEAPPVLRSLSCVHELYVTAMLHKPLRLLMVPEEKEFLKSLILTGDANLEFYETVKGTINSSKIRDPTQAVIVDELAEYGQESVVKQVGRMMKACYVEVINDVIASVSIETQSMEVQKVYQSLGACYQLFGDIADAQVAFEKAVDAGKVYFFFSRPTSTGRSPPLFKKNAFACLH